MTLTTESQFVAEQLALLLHPGSHYRVGALLLTYDCGDPDGCRIAHLADELDRKLGVPR